jgi:hypothetical protein
MSDQVIARRNIFLDTQVFVGNNFDYSNRNFLQLASFVRENRISLYTTSITVDEVKANILENVGRAKSAVKSIRDTAKILRNCQAPSFSIIWDRFDSEAISSVLITQFEDYIRNCNTTFVPINGPSIQDIFCKYFSNLPPFKEGNKKYEFPDAFTIAALELWGVQNGQSIYVISGDDDWKLACGESNPHLFWLEKLEALFQKIEFDDRLIAEHSEPIFNHHLDEIKNNIKDIFESKGFYIDSSNSSKMIDDEHVENVVVDNIDLVEKYLVSVNDNTMVFNCEFDVQFQAEVLYEDNTYAFYDDENDRYLFGESINETFELSHITTVEVEISFTREEPVQSELEGTCIKEDDICIMLEDN